LGSTGAPLDIIIMMIIVLHHDDVIMLIIRVRGALRGIVGACG
jgi:hypothetical protein